MKKIVLVLTAFVSVQFSAQQVSDHAFIMVPEKFNDFKETNQYNLNKLLGSSLTGKQYTIITDLAQAGNPCSALTADVADTSNIFKTKIELKFTDCNGKVISNVPSSSDIKDFERGFQEALRTALKQVPAKNPQSSAVTSSVVTPPVVNNTKAISVPANNNVSYVYKSDEYQKVADNSGNFSLIRKSDGLPFARFFRTSKNGVYLVKLNSEQTTVAFDEGSQIIVDTPSTSGKQVMNFKAK